MNSLQIEKAVQVISDFLEHFSVNYNNFAVNTPLSPTLSPMLDSLTQELNLCGTEVSNLFFKLFRQGQPNTEQLEVTIRQLRIFLVSVTMGRSATSLTHIVSEVNQFLFIAFGTVTLSISTVHEQQLLDDICAIIESEKREGEISLGSYLAMQLMITSGKNIFPIPLDRISEPFASLFLTYRFPFNPTTIDFWCNGEAACYLEKSVLEAQVLLQNISWIKSNLDTAGLLSNHLFHKTTFLPGYFVDKPQKALFSARGKIYEQAMNIAGYSLDYTFPVSRRKRKRIGFLSSHFTPQTETFVTLPAFEHLDRNRYEIILYTERISGRDSLEQHCFASADRIVKLPEKLEDRVSAVRSDDLDFLVIGNNITVHARSTSTLALFRLARHTAVTSCCPVTTGFSSIDYYISGSYTEPEIDVEYCEQRLLIDGPAHSFDYGFGEEQLIQEVVAAFPQKKESALVVFVSGANFFKLNRDLFTCWVKILSNVPSSCLILYPFNPNWSSQYPQRSLNESIAEVCREYGVGMDRIMIVPPLAHRTAVLELLSKCDIYLDSFPYSGATSLVDPLLVGLPVVALAGVTARCRQSYAILKSMNLEQLAPGNIEMYMSLAVTMAQNVSFRNTISEKIKSALLLKPKFRDSYRFSKEMERLFDNV